MSERHSLIDTITDSIAPVHQDGYKFLAIGAVVSLLLFLLWPPLAWLAVLVTAWIAYFFRDPARVTPLREGLVVAPGDGRIAPSSACARRPSSALATAERVRISIFLSVFDVHINRAPVAGRIARSIYVPRQLSQRRRSTRRARRTSGAASSSPRPAASRSPSCRSPA